MIGMNEQLTHLKEMQTQWYGELDDIVDDLKDAMFEVEEVNSEWIDAWGQGDGDKDVLYTLRLGGTEHTIIITDVSFNVY